MRELLLHYYLRLYEVLVLLALVAGAVAVAFWIAWRHWRSRHRSLERTLTAKYSGSYDTIESVVSHRWLQHMAFIHNRSTETLNALGEDQEPLCVKQRRIRAKTNELERQAKNTMLVFGPEPEVKPVLLNVSKLLNGVVASFFEYADDQGVTLRPALAPIEPTLLDPSLTEEAYGNVIHNAIKYSAEGRVVEVSLALEKWARHRKQSVVCVRVTNVPREVIPEQVREKIFEPRKRADGLIEPGHGLGLYIARRAARLQRGDVTLVQNRAEGVIFEIVLPYTEMIELDD